MKKLITSILTFAAFVVVFVFSNNVVAKTLNKNVYTKQSSKTENKNLVLKHSNHLFNSVISKFNNQSHDSHYSHDSHKSHYSHYSGSI